MKKRIVFIIVVGFMASFGFAQATDTIQPQSQYQKPVPVVKPEKKKQTSYRKIFYGGSIGLSFGSYTSIRLNPMIGYRLTSKLSTGFKFLYEYSKYHSSYNSDKTYDNYGASIFARYRFIPQAYIHAEYNFVNYQAYGINGDSYRYTVPYLLVGGGFIQKVGANTFLYAEILFDVLNDSNSQYSPWNPFYSFGVSVGF